MYIIKNDGTAHLLPYDKFESQGPQALSDEELLAVLLRTGTGGEDALTVACHVLRLCGPDKGLIGLYHLSLSDLVRIRGVGKVKAIKLLAAAELARRISNSCVKKDVCLRSGAAVADAYMERMRHLEKEQLMVVFLDSDDRRIGDEVISEGTMNNTFLSSREIYRKALFRNAAAIIVLHNHPSGNPYPSEDDIAATARLKEVSGYMEIPLLDHVIIGDNDYYSFSEKGDL